MVAVSTPAGVAADDAALVSCRQGLERSVEVMLDRPLLKEEVATELMWLRLDVDRALRDGDAEGCLDRLAAVDGILGLRERDRQTSRSPRSTPNAPSPAR